MTAEEGLPYCKFSVLSFVPVAVIFREDVSTVFGELAVHLKLSFRFGTDLKALVVLWNGATGVAEIESVEWEFETVG
jgi:hypothetical protein